MSKRRAFTVVELLVVIGVIILVVGTLAVGLTAAMRRAREAKTEFLMDSISKGMAQFKASVGYLPPVLGDPSVAYGGASTPSGQVGYMRDLVAPPSLPAGPSGGNYWGNWSAAQGAQVQRYGSITTIAEYLLGPGDRSQDGYGVIVDTNGSLPSSDTPGGREQDTMGLRDPGRDGVWGALLNPRPSTSGGGLFANRNLATPNMAGNNTSTGYLKGARIGPFLELKDDGLLGAAVGAPGTNTLSAIMPNEPGYTDLAPKCVLDYFGKPIVYYRRGYLNSDPRTTDSSWSLADIIALRPQRFPENEALNGYPDGLSDGSTSRELKAAEFALLSLGPDQRYTYSERADNAGYNEDNVVRTGP